VTSYVRQVGGRTTSIVNKAYRGCDRGRTTSIAAQLRQTLVNSPPGYWHWGCWCCWQVPLIDWLMSAVLDWQVPLIDWLMSAVLDWKVPLIDWLMSAVLDWQVPLIDWLMSAVLDWQVPLIDWLMSAVPRGTDVFILSCLLVWDMFSWITRQSWWTTIQRLWALTMTCVIVSTSRRFPQRFALHSQDEMNSRTFVKNSFTKRWIKAYFSMLCNFVCLAVQ